VAAGNYPVKTQGQWQQCSRHGDAAEGTASTFHGGGWHNAGIHKVQDGEKEQDNAKVNRKD